MENLTQIAQGRQIRTEIDFILGHSIKNSLCAFGLQNQLLQFYLLEGLSEEAMAKLLEISQRSQAHVEKINQYVEELRWLIQLSQAP